MSSNLRIEKHPKIKNAWNLYANREGRWMLVIQTRGTRRDAEQAAKQWVVGETQSSRGDSMSVDEYEAKSCENCGRPPSTEDYPCQCDCDHSDMEDGYCLICDKDCTEDLAAEASDRVKESLKYGE